MKTEYEKCLAGEPFNGGRDLEIAEMTLQTRRLLAMLHATDYADTDRRQALLRELFGSMGNGVHVDIDFHCEYGKNISHLYTLMYQIKQSFSIPIYYS